ncbi:MAG: DUF1152 domain-containing protein [Bacteroidota bacterium]
MTSLHQIPFWKHIQNSENILLAGAGGGFDIYSGIPIYQSLLAAGRQVVLANYSFTWLAETSAKEVFPHCYEVRMSDVDRSGRNYFPEKHLCAFFGTLGKNLTVYGFQRLGVRPILNAYKHIIKQHNIDTIILIDGGTDSLMFGDEEGLGTPVEDICSMAAAYRTGVKKQFLLSIGFGIDHYHGVSHYRFLENLAELIKDGGYLGAIHLLPEMEEAKVFIDLVAYANKHMPARPSIVANSIASAIDGRYGDYHRTTRTLGSELWINPLMHIYWAFDLRKVIQKVKYYEYIKNSQTVAEISAGILTYQRQLKVVREKRRLPI